MTYDLHGAWDPVIGFNAPLFAGAADKTELQQQLNVNASLSYWLSEGIPADKVVVGIPFYGRSFQLVSADQHQPEDPHHGPGIGGPYTGESGNYGFNEICEYIVPNRRWQRDWSQIQAVPFFRSEKQWIGYDDMESVAFKANYINEQNLGGAMVWSIETDDFRNLCQMGHYPLLRQINGIFGNAVGEWEAVTTETPGLTTDGEVSSSSSEENTECADSGMFRDPSSCSTFIICSHGYKYRMECPKGLFYDPENRSCTWPELASCS